MSKTRFSQEFVTEVLNTFPTSFWCQDPDELAIFGKDWTSFYTPNAGAIAFPKSTQEVSQFLKLCSKYRVPVIPSGGRTGLAGGAVATQGEVILSLSRMNQMHPVDPVAHTVRVEAGAITETIHRHCQPHGLTWPVDFASKGSSQVGGNISTNAGGVRVIRYGLTRNWVLGLQVVTMNGDILELGGALEKNNTGIDLRQLFIGSEGTLGVITEATLKLTQTLPPADVFFFAVADIPGVLKLFHEARKTPYPILAFEFLTHNCLQAVAAHRGIHPPFEKRSETYVLLEIEKSQNPSHLEDQNRWLESLFEKNLVIDGTLAQSPRETRELWSLREGITESIGSQGFVHKNDISLPISHLVDFIRDMNAMYQERHSDLAVFLFGHIGDGNLHISTLKPRSMNKAEFGRLCKRADQGLFAVVQKYSGSISAEHGIGLLKKESLHFTRTPVEIHLMKELKNVFDPLGLLNPGKIF
jgi:FAD/FMN-containing dehydrogenase